jgi:hypothetical protein
MSKRPLLARLLGWPIITTKYRAHYRVMINAHPMILKLIEDNEDGDTRRASLAEWQRAERPVLAVFRGTTSLFRIDGPRQCIGREDFAMGALIESPGVTAHLDPVDTLHLEERVRKAIEQEILKWIADMICKAFHPLKPALIATSQTPKPCGV